MPRVNTSDTAWEGAGEGGGGSWIREPGDKVLSVVGLVGPIKTSTGTSKYTAFLVCVRDLAGKGQEGRDTTDDFFLTDKALSRLVGAVKVANNFDPVSFDTDKPEEVVAALSAGPLLATVRMEAMQGGGTISKVDGFYRSYAGEFTEQELEQIGQIQSAATERFEAWRKRLADPNRKKRQWGSRPSGGGGGSGAAGSGAGSWNDQNPPF